MIEPASDSASELDSAARTSGRWWWLRPVALSAMLVALLASPHLVPPGDQASELRELDAALAARDELFDRVVEAVASQSGLDPEVVTGERLRPMDSLEAPGDPVPAEARERLERATVRIVKRHRRSSRWAPVCTGVLVVRSGSVAVVTVPDCFSLDLLDRDGASDATDGDAEGGNDWYAQAPVMEHEIAEELPTVYGIVDRSTPVGEVRPRTTLERIAIADDWYWGWAVASVANESGLLDRAIPLDELIGEPMTAPTAGQSAATWAFPKGGGPSGRGGAGVYLGRTSDPYDLSEASRTDHVALPADSRSARDACSAGSLGATAVLSDGTHLGLLRSRNTLGRGPDREFAEGEYDGRLERLQIEAQLELDIPDDRVLCSYAVADLTRLARLWPLLDRPAEKTP